jgi:hypothetical protein
MMLCHQIGDNMEKCCNWSPVARYNPYHQSQTSERDWFGSIKCENRLSHANITLYMWKYHTSPCWCWCDMGWHMSPKFEVLTCVFNGLHLSTWNLLVGSNRTLLACWCISASDEMGECAPLMHWWARWSWPSVSNQREPLIWLHGNLENS